MVRLMIGEDRDADERPVCLSNNLMIEHLIRTPHVAIRAGFLFTFTTMWYRSRGVALTGVDKVD